MRDTCFVKLNCVKYLNLVYSMEESAISSEKL